MAVPPEPATLGALALGDPAEEDNDESEPVPDSGLRIVPPPVPAAGSPDDDNQIDQFRTAVVQSLESGGHSTAATLIDDAQWTLDSSTVRIQVNAKPTMIRITFNAQAEKLIRQGLAQAGAPSCFLIVPGEGAVASASPRPRVALGSIEAEARSHPLVQRAQQVFNAEICSVVDLREK
jgi:DNA polymerase-3 subunit gamma/tau